MASRDCAQKTRRGVSACIPVPRTTLLVSLDAVSGELLCAFCQHSVARRRTAKVHRGEPYGGLRQQRSDQLAPNPFRLRRRGRAGHLAWTIDRALPLRSRALLSGALSVAPGTRA